MSIKKDNNSLRESPLCFTVDVDVLNNFNSLVKNLNTVNNFRFLSKSRLLEITLMRFFNQKIDLKIFSHKFSTNKKKNKLLWLLL